jgi:hypothetical protein
MQPAPSGEKSPVIVRSVPPVDEQLVGCTEARMTIGIESPDAV